MSTGFAFSDDNKRYHTLSYHNRHTYGRRVCKAVIDAGFTCPNIDGTKGTGGCAFCSGGSGYFTADPAVPVSEQFRREKERILRKYPDALVIAYFQAHTNTYAELSTLKALYSEAISAGADGISIATRTDCINEESAELIRSLGVPATVELGLQSIHDRTTERMNCHHSSSDFLNAMRLLKEYGIRTCVHLIDGLPGETHEMMCETAEAVGKQRPDAVKIQLLHVIKGTPLHEMFLRGEYIPMTRESYIDTVVRQLGYLPPETVIERVTGDGDKRTLVAPMWSTDKIAVLGGIDRRMKELDVYQGDSCSQKA
ncbi:MAG: TIGR01212 family radical SAM protein [Ruminiclostridium sp.]|nr:TIGR01212 family radical SAM protein [Ruminiclostridium sp.]